MIQRRLQLWESNRHQDLLEELYDQDSDQQATLRQQDKGDFEEGREKRVASKIKAGELSKALLATMSDEPYQGNVDKLIDLHPPKPVAPHLPPLPTDITPPHDKPRQLLHGYCLVITRYMPNM